MKLRIQHRTTYRDSENVSFGPHRIMRRPREGHDIHIESSILEISPAHEVHWMRDMNGNCVALVDFIAPAGQLMIYSELMLKHYDSNPFDFKIETEALRYPFSYNEKTLQELGAFRQMVYPGEAAFLQNWLARFWTPGTSVDTLVLRQNLNSHLYTAWRDQSREKEGVQLETETLRRRRS